MNAALADLDLSSKGLSEQDASKVADRLRAANGTLVKFDVSKNSLYAEGTKVVAEALKGNQIMTELSISGNRMTYDGSNSGNMSGVIAISNAIPTMGALTSLNISNNRIGWLALPEGWKDIEHAGKQHFLKPGSSSYSLTPPPGAKPEGIIAIANAIPTMGALVKFDISNNSLYEKGATTLAAALTGNQIMTELNMSKNNMTFAAGKGHGQKAGVTAFANAISTMGAMKKLTVSGDASDSRPVTIETSMTEADFRDKALGISGAIMLAAFLPKCR